MRDLGHIAAMIGVLAGASAHASGHGASWIFRFRTLFVGISRNAAYIRDSQTDRGLLVLTVGDSHSFPNQAGHVVRVFSAPLFDLATR